MDQATKRPDICAGTRGVEGGQLDTRGSAQLDDVCPVRCKCFGTNGSRVVHGDGTCGCSIHVFGRCMHVTVCWRHATANSALEVVASKRGRGRPKRGKIETVRQRVVAR